MKHSKIATWAGKMARGIAAAGLALSVVGAAHAQLSTDPAPTAAGRSVTNDFTLTYDVGTVTQPPVTNSGNPPATFTVDRVVNLDVALSNGVGGYLDVAPNQQDAELIFTVTNLGNDRQAYDLDLLANTPTPDDFDVANLTVFLIRDDDNSGTIDGSDTRVEYTFNNGAIVPADFDGTAGTFFDIEPGETFQVVVQGDIPVTQVDGEEAPYTLIANTLYAEDSLDNATDAATGPDLNLTQISTGSTANTEGGPVDNALTDPDGPQDAAADGSDSDAGIFRVAAPDVNAVKTVAVLSDGSGTFDCESDATPGTLPTDQLFIPGACVEYTITVTNAGSEFASNIDVIDVLPAGLIFEATTLSGWTSTGTPPTGVTPVPGTTPTFPTSHNPSNGDRCDNIGGLTAADVGTITTPPADACFVYAVDGELAPGTTPSPTTATVVIRASVAATDAP